MLFRSLIGFTLPGVTLKGGLKEVKKRGQPLVGHARTIMQDEGGFLFTNLNHLPLSSLILFPPVMPEVWRQGGHTILLGSLQDLPNLGEEMLFGISSSVLSQLALPLDQKKRSKKRLL